MPKRNISIDEIIWPRINESNEPIIQYRMKEDFSGNEEEPTLIQPGDRIKLAKQVQFIKWALKYREVLYGGAAGGGKSYILLMVHVFFHLMWNAMGIKGVISGMFCETFKALGIRQISRIKTRLPSWLGTYNKSEFEFVFKEKFGGGTIMFCNLDDPDKYSSAEFALITIDELTRNDEYTFQAVRSRLRWPGVPHRCILSTTNPGGVGHKWVHKRYVDPAWRKPGCAFIQCLPQENPFIDEEYNKNILGDMPENRRRALQEGRWDVFEGQFFDMLEPSVHQIRRFKIPDEVPKFLAIDHGNSHPTGAMWGALFPSSDEYPRGRLVIYRYYEAQDKWTDNHKKKIWELMKNDKNIISVVLGHDAFSRRNSVMGNKTPAERYNSDDEYGPSFNAVSSGQEKKEIGWKALLNGLSFESEIITDPFGNTRRKISKPPQIYFFSDLDVCWDELIALKHRDGDPDNLEKVSGSMYKVGQGDEAADCLRYLWMSIEGADLIMGSEDESDFDPNFNYDKYYRDKAFGTKSDYPYARF